MTHLPTPTCFAAFLGSDVSRHDIGMVGLIGGLVFAGTMAIAGMYFKNRRRQLWHETARLALEKGQPLPPALGEESQPPHAYGPTPQWAEQAHSPARDLRSGLILIGTGVGLYFFLGLGIAAIPGFIGIALLLHGLLSLLFRKKAKDDAPQA